MAAYFLVNFVVSTVLPPFQGPWVAHLCVDVVFMFVWYALLLYLLRRSERFLQTMTAVYGFQAVIAPLFDTANWLTGRFEQDSIWQAPASLLSMGLLIWIIAANSHIVKAALEWSTAQSVALVILQTLAGILLVISLFPITNA